MSEEVLVEEQEENQANEVVSNNQHPYDLAGEWFVLPHSPGGVLLIYSKRRRRPRRIQGLTSKI